MKKIFLFICAVASLFAAQGQRLIVNGWKQGGGASSALYWELNLSNQFQDGTAAPAGWNTINNTGGTGVTTAGGIVKSNLKKSDGTTSAVGFTNVTALNGTRSVANQGSNQGVFPDFIENQAWEFPNGGQVKFTGLDNAKQYTVYVHGNAQPWEGGTISFSVGGTTSGQTTTASNVGGSTYPNWETDPALIKINNISPTSGEIVITVNVISGLGMVDAIVLKQQ